MQSVAAAIVVTQLRVDSKIAVHICLFCDEYFANSRTLSFKGSQNPQIDLKVS